MSGRSVHRSGAPSLHGMEHRMRAFAGSDGSRHQLNDMAEDIKLDQELFRLR